MTGKPNGRGGARPGAGRKPKQAVEEIKRGGNQIPAEPSRRGGARPGAGRKPKAATTSTKKTSPAAVEENLEKQAHGGALKRTKSKPVPMGDRDMLEMLKDVALGNVEATMLQVRAAIAAVQYTHVKKGDGGKKEGEAERAKKAASRFAPSSPPRLVANGGRKI
jgi:phage terminase small subunit